MGFRGAFALVCGFAIALPVFGLDTQSWKDIQHLLAEQKLSLDWKGPPANADELRARVTLAKEAIDAAVDRALSSDPSVDEFDAVFEPLDHALYRWSLAGGRAALVQLLFRDGELFDAATTALQELQTQMSTLQTNQELYLRLKAYREASLSETQRRLLEILLNQFVESSRKVEATIDNWEMTGLTAALEKAEQEFSNGLHARGSLKFSARQLSGVKPEFLARLPRDGSLYVVDTSTWWQTDHIMNFCRVEATRRALWIRSATSAEPENEKRVELILAGRRRLAKRLGNASWAEMTAIGLSSTPRKLLAQFEQFLQKSEEAFQAEKREMRRLLGREPQVWDVGHATSLKLAEMGVNEAELRRFFPVEAVLEGLFEYVRTVYGMKVVRVEGMPLWKGARGYALLDARTNRFLGGFSMDAYPRKGKSPDFLVAPLESSVLLPEGQKRPFVHLHLNLNPPVDDTPSLLNTEEVWTIFHEFGHVLHYLASDQKYYSLGGEGQNWDVIEFPSTFFERLAWEPAILRRFARDWETGEAPTSEQLEGIAAARTVFGVHTMRARVARTVMDLKLHAARTRSANDVGREVYARYYYPLPEQVKSLAASNGHFTGGYEALYWSYPWAEGLATQFLEQVKASPRGLFDRTQARRLRNRFLAAGSRSDGKALIGSVLDEPFRLCSALLRSAGLPGK